MALGSTIGEAGWAECESVIRRFEDAWREDDRPDPGAFLTPNSPHSSRLLVELVHIDLEFRLRAGESARTEDYLDRFPELRDPELIVDLLEAEFSLRNRYCPPVWPEEFWLRFPNQMAALRVRLPLESSVGALAATRPAERPGAPFAGPPSIAGYEILGELGRGGMGVVYQARDIILHRTVALKTFATVPRPESCTRFAREAEAIARLDHPHIVPVYEVGEWVAAEGRPGVPYFAMKWYPGGSLDGAPAGPAADIAAQARLVETIARAVHHAHQRGILHRDLKPSNILLDDLGLPHVADFGLAGRVDADERTMTAVIAGTPAYMAPEQARSPKHVSTAADVYGLGAILYHQLTGQPPFIADTPLATLELVATTPPAPPSTLNRAVSRDLDTITLKCLEKDPTRRYPSAAALADDLERWRTGMPITARPTSPWEHAWRRVRRHPVVSALAATTLAALVGGVAVLADSNSRIRAKEKETSEALARESLIREELQDSLSREQRALYLERVSSAGRMYAANQLPQAWELLDQCPVSLRGWEWRYLDSLRRDAGIALEGHNAYIGEVGFLPDGRLISADVLGYVRTWDLSGRRELQARKLARSPITGMAVHPGRSWVATADFQGVTVWNADTGRQRATLKGTNWVLFSPDGKFAVTNDESALRLWRVPSGETESSANGGAARWEPAGGLLGHEGQVIAGVFTPDGKRLVTSSMDRTIRTWDVEKRVQVSSRRVPKPVRGLALASNGQILAEAHLGYVVFTDLATGEVRDRLEYPTGDRTAVAASPEGQSVAVGGSNGEVVVWDVNGRRPRRVYRGHTASVAALAFGPGGRLASAGGDEIVRVWDLAREQGVRSLAWVADGVGGLDISHDGSRVAVGPRYLDGGHTPLILDVATGRQVHRPAGTSDAIFHPRSGHLFTGRVGGGAVLWDSGSGGELWSKPFPYSRDPGVVAAPGSRRMAVSPDGSRLATWDMWAGGIQLWNTKDGTDAGLIEMEREFVYAIAFTADGSKIAAATANSLVLWDAATRKALPWGDGPQAGITTIAFSRDGQWLATVDRDRIIRLRNAATARVVRSFIGTALRVNALAFSPDSTRLVTGGSDRTVRIWDVGTGRELLSLPGMTEGVVGVVWDGARDRIYALDLAVRYWSTSPE